MPRSDNQNLIDFDVLNEEFEEAQNGPPPYHSSLDSVPSVGQAQNGEATAIDLPVRVQGKHNSGGKAWLNVKKTIYRPFDTILQPQGDESYLPWSIMNSICCCLVFGIIAMVFSIKSLRAKEKGNSEQARRCSLAAYRLNVISTFLGAVGVMTVLVLWNSTTILDPKDKPVTLFD